MSWQEAAEENRRTACTDFTAEPSGFTAVTGGDTSRLLYFSVPHDNGWRAFIDGEETEIFTVNYGMMGIVVPPGEGQRLEFRFEPPGLKAGAVLSLFLPPVFLFIRLLRAFCCGTAAVIHGRAVRFESGRPQFE